MEFDRTITVAVKIFLVDFFLYLLGIIFLIPLILSGNLLIEIVVSFVLGLCGLVVTVYFILDEAEKISRETESYAETL